MFVGVYTCTLCSCEDQSWREKAVGGVTTMVRGLSLFVHKNGVCVGPGPPSSILYQLTPTPHPHTHTPTLQRRKMTRAWCFSFFYFFFSSFSSRLPLSVPFAVTRFIAFRLWSLSKITGLKLLTHEGSRNEDRDVCRDALCVHVIYCSPFPIVSVALCELFSVSCGLIMWCACVCV